MTKTKTPGTEGKDARLSGLPLAENPYVRDTAAWWAWLDGWKEASEPLPALIHPWAEIRAALKRLLAESPAIPTDKAVMLIMRELHGKAVPRAIEKVLAELRGEQK